MRTTITQPKIDFQTKQVIADVVYDVLSDPDFGLELRPEMKKSLKTLSNYRGRRISLAAIKKRHL